MADLGHEPVLEGTREVLHTALGLRRAGEDLGDPQFLHRSGELGRRTLGAASGRDQEDAVAVGVERERQSAALDDLLHQREIAACVLGWPEERVGHIAGRVVNREQEGEGQHPRAVLGRSSLAGAGHAGLLQDPPDRETAQAEPLVLPEQFAQVRVVGARVALGGKAHDGLSQSGR